MKKQLIILSTQRSGSTMLCDDIQGTGQLGYPSEYFIDTIEKFVANKNTSELSSSFYSAIKNGKSNNGIESMKIMSNQIFVIGEIISKISNDKEEALNCFYKYISSGYIILLERKDKVAQAVSRILARQRKIYHLVDKNSNEELRGVGLQTNDLEENANLVYSKKEIEDEIENIKKEEIFLLDFLSNYKINYKKLYYEDIVENRDYVYEIVTAFEIKNITLQPRRLKKIAGSIGDEWIKRYKAEN